MLCCYIIDELTSAAHRPAGFFLHSLSKYTEKGIFLLKITEKEGKIKTGASRYEYIMYNDI